MHLTAAFIQSNLNSRIKIYFMNWNEINILFIDQTYDLGVLVIGVHKINDYYYFIYV